MTVSGNSSSAGCRCHDNEREYLLTHRCHDFEELTGRWRAVSDACGLRMEEIAEADGLPIHAIANGLAPSRGRGLYLSAGVHGDEPAAVEGLISWAERNPAFLKSHPVAIFPCLNPFGLVKNTRADGAGRDLNRIFERGDLAPVRQWQSWLEGKEFRLAVALHEDYDAQGAYVYELGRAGCAQYGDRVLRASDAILPRHPGEGVEGRAADGGVIRPDREIDAILKEIEGMPEAIYLYLHHADVSLTFETPSEYSLYARAKAHERVLEAVVGMCA